MKCPRDNETLKRKRLKDVRVDVCPKCHGVWLDGGELRRLVGYFSTRQPETTEALLEQWFALDDEGFSPPHEFWQEDDISCPKDGVHLRKHYFAGTRIGIDNCAVCKGFWIDGPELAAIANEVEPNPMLDKAGKYLLEEYNSFEKKLQADLKKAGEFLYAGIGMFNSPVLAMYLLGSLIVRAIIDDINYLSGQDR